LRQYRADVCRRCGQSKANHDDGIGAARDCVFEADAVDVRRGGECTNGADYPCDGFNSFRKREEWCANCLARRGGGR